MLYLFTFLKLLICISLQDLHGLHEVVSDKSKKTQKDLDRSLLLWQKFQEIQQKIQNAMTETLFNLGNFQVATGDFDQVSSQVDQLKVRNELCLF